MLNTQQLTLAYIMSVPPENNKKIPACADPAQRLDQIFLGKTSILRSRVLTTDSLLLFPFTIGLAVGRLPYLVTVD